MSARFGKRLEKAFLATSALALASLVPWFVSCATKDDTTPEEDAATIVIPEASVDATGDDEDAAPDAGCDASDPTCSSSVITCDHAAWCPVATGVSTLYVLTSIWGSSATDLWAVGSGGTIIHGDGTAWVETPTDTKSTFHGVWGSGPNDVWAVSMTDTLLHTTGFAGGTATWSVAPAAQFAPNNKTVRAVLAIWGASATDVRLGARDYSIYTGGAITPFNQFTSATDGDGGAGWAPVSGLGAVQAIWGSSATDVWYTSDNSTKNGWQKGVTMHGTAADDDGGHGGAMTWTAVDSQASVILGGLWGSGPNDVWAVGDSGVIRHFTGGARWDIVDSPTTEALHAIWGSGPSDVWAVGDYGTILHYDGTAWQPSTAALAVGKKKHLYGIWGSGPNDAWIVGDGISLHYTGPKPAAQGDTQ